jgi:hypothetical protein
MNTQSMIATDPSLSKLLRVYGAERSTALVQDTMREIGVDTLQNPDDRLRFGAALIKRGGLLEAIGRAIRIQAILHGAREESRTSARP